MSNPSAAPLDPDSMGAAALEALQKAKAENEAGKVISGDDITSLNKLLQWSTAHSNPDDNSQTPQQAIKKTPEQLGKDREWLDAAFPDTYAEIKTLARLLDDDQLDHATIVDTLHALEEYVVDLNFAVNIESVGALQPVLRHAKSESHAVRAAAIWVLGTAMRDLPEVKQICMRHDVHHLLVEALADQDDVVRAKAVMASSALLRHASLEIRQAFRDVDGTARMRALLADDNVQVRRRARFFLQHAMATGNDDFVVDLLNDQSAVASLSASMHKLHLDDVADVEAAAGALTVLVDKDLHGLLQVAPELPGTIDSLAKQCSDHDLTDLLSSLASTMD